jgi:hypothetical protein
MRPRADGTRASRVYRERRRVTSHLIDAQSSTARWAPQDIFLLPAGETLVSSDEAGGSRRLIASLATAIEGRISEPGLAPDSQVCGFVEERPEVLLKLMLSLFFLPTETSSRSRSFGALPVRRGPHPMVGNGMASVSSKQKGSRGTTLGPSVSVTLSDIEARLVASLPLSCAQGTSLTPLKSRRCHPALHRLR